MTPDPHTPISEWITVPPLTDDQRTRAAAYVRARCGDESELLDMLGLAS